jgi:folate-binding protein YgfZ
MAANGFLWRTPAGDGFRLALSSDIAEAARKRLAMFVLRSKVAIRDLTPTCARIGIGGPRARPAAAEALGALPAAGTVASANGADVVALPDGRVFVLVPQDIAAAIRDRLAATTIPGEAAAWRRFAVQAGTPLVRAATQDQLLPQAVNLDALGAVVLNPEKGCFPGQEIIKRMQALGQLKERLYAYGAAARAPDLGTRLFGATFADQPCGIVVESADVPEGGSVLLAVVQIRAAESDVLRLGAPDGPALSARPLPYEVPAAVPANRPPRIGA